jgi:hypothetical protein
MIYHLSIAAHHPKRVAHVLAELFQGEAYPFPDRRYSDSYVALAFDPYETVVDVHREHVTLVCRKTTLV